MHFIITKDHKEFATVMSQMMLKHMLVNKDRVNIAITTGSTCIDGYSILAPQIKNKSYFKNIHYYIFDEFWFHDEDHKNEIPISKTSLDKKFFHKADIKADKKHDLDFENYKTFDQDIINDGGFEFVIMGIGMNGHFCGNQPGTFDSWSTGTRLVRCNATEYLKTYTKKLLQSDFHSEDESRIPEHYITMGPKTIMDARNIIFILQGKDKAAVAKKALLDPISLNFPASIFQLHQNVTVILDEEAAELIKDFI